MKVPRWTVRLAEEVAAARSRPFAYGTHDCLQFAARCVEATTGVDHAAEFGSYDDPTTLLESNGGVSGILIRLFGPMEHPARASEGDVVLASIAGQESAGVCLGTKFAFASQAGGITFLPRSMIEGCWKP